MKDESLNKKISFHVRETKKLMASVSNSRLMAELGFDRVRNICNKYLYFHFISNPEERFGPEKMEELAFTDLKGSKLEHIFKATGLLEQYVEFGGYQGIQNGGGFLGWVHIFGGAAFMSGGDLCQLASMSIQACDKMPFASLFSSHIFRMCVIHGIEVEFNIPAHELEAT